MVSPPRLYRPLVIVRHLRSRATHLAQQNGVTCCSWRGAAQREIYEAMLRASTTICRNGPDGVRQQKAT